MRLEISIDADTDANADVKGRGAPILLRIYELKSDTVFQDADFFSLQDHDKITLGADLLATDQFILLPGEHRDIARPAQADSRSIGIFAAYRDLPNVRWRLTHTLVPAPHAHWYRALASAAKTRLAVRIQARTVLVVDADAKPAPGPITHAAESAQDREAVAPAAIVPATLVERAWQ